MQFFQSGHSFLSPDNTLGFGITDLAELALVAVLIAALRFQKRCERLARALSRRTVASMLALAALPVVLRLALLAHHAAPTPRIYDEFSHLLVADTLRHFRLANPPHALHQFFETFFVIQQPSYSSIYPIGQGLALAIGWTIFGLPWAGVILSVAALCAFVYWMLRGWVAPEWALLGGLFAVFEFGPLSGWMNSYWGGAVPAFAGCLVFGALPRLRERARKRDAILLGAGLGIHLLTRPYESIFLLLSVILFFLPELRSRMQSVRMLRVAPVVVLAVLPAIAVTLIQNKEVTGRWTTLPYQLSQYQYGVPMSLTILPNPTPHLPLTREQRLEYISQRSYHGKGTDTPSKFFVRLVSRVRFYRSFFLVPLYIAFVIFLATIRSYRYGWLVLTFVLFALGTNLFPYFYPRYAGAEVCLFILASVVGLERLSQFKIRGHGAGRQAAAVLIALCIAMFAFRYTLYAVDNANSRPNYRRAIYQRLAKMPERQLVFVHYSPHHVFQHEWVYNRAEIDTAHVVWARDLGRAEDKKLRDYYPHRRCWLLYADAMPPLLTPYPGSTPSPFLEVP
ncbi:MAG: hypothetical protein ACRD34_10810 [Bryobacteraceae bacterium]